jgi:hypothetical protein
MLSVVYCLLFAVCRLPFAFCCLLSVGCCALSAALCLVSKKGGRVLYALLIKEYRQTPL